MLQLAERNGSIIERCVSKNGQTSATYFDVVQEFNESMCLVHFVLKTGRTHQIRVHSKFIGHPLIRRHFVWLCFASYF